MNFQRFPDANQALNDIDDRKADRPLSAPQLPASVVNGAFVCVENDDESSLYFGMGNTWHKLMFETEGDN